MCPFIDIPEFGLTCTNTRALGHKSAVELGLSFQLLSPKSRPQPHLITVFSPPYSASDLWAEVPPRCQAPYKHDHCRLPGLAHHRLRQGLQQELA